LAGVCLVAVQAVAQQRTITGRVTDEQGLPLAGVSVVIKGTALGTSSNTEGRYSIRAATGQVLQFRLLGTAPAERTVGTEDVIDVQLRRVAASLDAVVVTALGQTATQRALGTAQQTVAGADLAQTQRVSFVDALAGRVAGVDVNSSSGVPGASTSITIRGVSSISSSNQPLMIIDGMPMDNKTTHTGVLVSDLSSNTMFANRSVDFSNRSVDIDPEDIESIVVLKGPEAAALYGIDAANGAIVITTKRGTAGGGGLEYNNSFTFQTLRKPPEVQRVYDRTTLGGTFSYFGRPYPEGTVFHDNVNGFLRTPLSQRHNLSFSGAASDININYRLSSSFTKQEGVVPGSRLDRINLTGASQAQVTRWLNADLSMNYSSYNNDQPFKGALGPLFGVLLWPADDNASEYLTPAGTRRRVTTASETGEVDNPYFNVNKNQNTSRNDRLLANLNLTVMPFSWGNLKTTLGTDGYTNQIQLVRHPESASGFTRKGLIDRANDVTRATNALTVFNVNSREISKSISVNGFLGHYISDYKSTTSSQYGEDFLDPNFVSVNNTSVRNTLTTVWQRRQLSVLGQATIDYRHYLYLTVSGRNDWTSTIPRERNSFFYPSITTSFVFSDAFPSVGRFMSGKLRLAYAEVGKDARPYAYRPALENKGTSYGGYGYGFTGPNLGLKPEFKRSSEIGAELGFLNDRLGVDATFWRANTRDQIINDIRGSYATGFVLFNLNGGVTKNEGVELMVRGTPVQRPQVSWDVLVNFDKSRGKVVSLPNNWPETYVSDTWLAGNVRTGTAPGLSTRALMGQFYLRNKNCELLIDPTSGLPLRSTPFIDGSCGDRRAYDRQPDFTVGVTNNVRYKRFSLSFLFDIRKGGDIFNATEHYLTARGLSMRTLDRNEPRVIRGVLRDGKQDTDNPTWNTIVVIPAVQTGYYTNISEELFIERDINWLRLRDVTLRYSLPARFGRNASVFVTGTDLFLLTNYSGLDPIVNGNTAAVGGAGGVGIDYGNFPMPRTFSFGIRTAF
jgi:TonB-linked SusC/RagA family outer membrane protein